MSIASLERAGEKRSLAASARVSKAVNPTEPRGISESAILHNEEAFALHHQQVDRQPTPRPAPSRRTDAGGDRRIRVSADRDQGRARQRYLRASKSDLVDRLLNAEQAYAEMEDRWLRTADDMLVWIIVVDRLLMSNLSPKP